MRAIAATIYVIASAIIVASIVMFMSFSIHRPIGQYMTNRQPVYYGSPQSLTLAAASIARVVTLNESLNFLNSIDINNITNSNIIIKKEIDSKLIKYINEKLKKKTNNIVYIKKYSKIYIELRGKILSPSSANGNGLTIYAFVAANFISNMKVWLQAGYSYTYANFVLKSTGSQNILFDPFLFALVIDAHVHYTEAVSSPLFPNTFEKPPRNIIKKQCFVKVVAEGNDSEERYPAVVNIKSVEKDTVSVNIVIPLDKLVNDKDKDKVFVKVICLTSDGGIIPILSGAWIKGQK